MNFWLKLEQPLVHYLSGVREVLQLTGKGYVHTPPQCMQELDTAKPTILFTDNLCKFLQVSKNVWHRDWDKEELKQ